MAESIIRVFPHRTHWTPTDELAFFGPPPLFRPRDRSTPVHISVTFTQDVRRGVELLDEWRPYYDRMFIGGPAYPRHADNGDFVPGRYLREGCTITSRGCPKSCGYCAVPTNEGPLRELPIVPGWIVQDNNLLACSESHIRSVFEMLREQKRRIFFNGGLDKDYLRDWHRPLFDSIKLGELWFACDTILDLPRLEKVCRILDGIPIRKRRCYTMVGYKGETIDLAELRLNRVLELGFMPFCQLYQGNDAPQYSESWKALRRKWSRPAAYMGGPEVAVNDESQGVLAL